MASNATKNVLDSLGVKGLQKLQRSLAKKSTPEVEAMGRRIGKLFRVVDKKRVRIAQSNLALAMPELSAEERAALVPKVFEHFGMLLTDFLSLPSRSPEEIMESVEFPDVDRAQAIMDRGNGAIWITGHMGNWERFAAHVNARGVNMHVVARDANQSGVNTFVNEIRRNNGVEVIARGDATRQIIKAIRAGNAIGILADQNARDAFIPFFGHPAGTVLGPGVLAARTGAPVLPAFCVRTGPGKYRVMIYDELLVDPEESVKGESIMVGYNRALEDIIRQYPEQWLWLHDRWRNAKRKGLIPE